MPVAYPYGSASRRREVLQFLAAGVAAGLTGPIRSIAIAQIPGDRAFAQFDAPAQTITSANLRMEIAHVIGMR